MDGEHPKISQEHTSYDDLNDLELLRAYRQSLSDLYFRCLYHRYKHKVYAKCISLLEDEIQAKDAVQEIFIKVFLNIARFNENAKFSTWIYSITYNYCIDRIRRKKRQQKLFTEECDKPPEIVDDSIPDKLLLEIEVSRLEKVLNQIPVGDKAVLLMKYQDGMKIKEICKVFDKTESAIKMQIQRAKYKAHKTYLNLFGTRATISRR